MKTEQEIRERLAWFEKILLQAPTPLSAAIRGEIGALRWMLEPPDDPDDKGVEHDHTT